MRLEYLLTKVKAKDTVAANQMLNSLVLAPVFLFLYNILFFWWLKLCFNIPTAIRWNIVVCFFLIFPIYFRMCLFVYDKLKLLIRIFFVRIKYKLSKKFINKGKVFGEI